GGTVPGRRPTGRGLRAGRRRGGGGRGGPAGRARRRGWSRGRGRRPHGPHSRPTRPASARTKRETAAPLTSPVVAPETPAGRGRGPFGGEGPELRDYTPVAPPPSN